MKLLSRKENALPFEEACTEEKDSDGDAASASSAAAIVGFMGLYVNQRPHPDSRNTRG